MSAECVLAVDVGGTKLAVGVVDREARVLASERMATPRAVSADDLFQALEDLCRRVLDASGTPGDDFADKRVTAGVLLSLTGTGESLTPFAAENFPFMYPEFSDLTMPALIVTGDKDQSQLSTRGPDWFTDAYRMSPGARHLLTLFGGEHSLGGIVGYASAETTDEDPERVALIQRVTTAYLRTALGVDAESFAAVRAEVEQSPASVGRIDSK